MLPFWYDVEPEGNILRCRLVTEVNICEETKYLRSVTIPPQILAFPDKLVIGNTLWFPDSLFLPLFT